MILINENYQIFSFFVIEFHDIGYPYFPCMTWEKNYLINSNNETKFV